MSTDVNDLPPRYQSVVNCELMPIYRTDLISDPYEVDYLRKLTVELFKRVRPPVDAPAVIRDYILTNCNEYEVLVTIKLYLHDMACGVPGDVWNTTTQVMLMPLDDDTLEGMEGTGGTVH